jgi:hypothetical protein
VTPELFNALTSAVGRDLFAELANTDLGELHTLRILTEFRKRYPADLVAAALEVARLRIRGREKFGAAADQMFFTRDALEQATDSRISRYRAALIPPGAWVADFGCGIGGDSIALCEQHALIALDRDTLRLRMARLNVPHPAVTFIQADLSHPLPMSLPTAAFFDPARRTADGKRIFTLRDYQPPLFLLEGWNFPVFSKLSPGIQLEELSTLSLTPHRIEFISLNGELKECVILTGGDLGLIGGSIATVIEENGAIYQMSRVGEQVELSVQSPRRYLYEPDPAVIRAGMVGDWGATINATLIDPTIAYLTGDQAIESPYARFWEIADWLPFNLKKLRAYLRERGVGRVTVKKRGSPLTPEELISKLKLEGGGEERIIFLTRVQGHPAVIVGK